MKATVVLTEFRRRLPVHQAQRPHRDEAARVSATECLEFSTGLGRASAMPAPTRAHRVVTASAGLWSGQSPALPDDQVGDALDPMRWKMARISAVIDSLLRAHEMRRAATHRAEIGHVQRGATGLLDRRIRSFHRVPTVDWETTMKQIVHGAPSDRRPVTVDWRSDALA